MTHSRSIVLKVLIGLLLPVTLLLAGETRAKNPEQTPLRVQLQWKHQAQFSGLYVANERGYFKENGLNVEYRLGGTGINPINELQSGRADVAIAWFKNAHEKSGGNKRVLNIAQVFTKSSLLIVCRTSAGVYSVADLRGKSIGVWFLGGEYVIREILARSGIPLESVRIVRQRPDGADLIDGTLPCVTAMEYNEYWKIINSGLDHNQLTVFTPEQFGLPHVEDGIYVLAERLKDPAFQNVLVKFLAALRKGWAETRKAPTLALDIVGRMDPSLDSDHQRHMLETVLAAIPEDRPFGLFNLADYESALKLMDSVSADRQRAPEIWTHRIWNRMVDEYPGETDMAGKPRFGMKTFNNSTLHYLKSVFNSRAYGLAVLLATLAFALSAAFLAIDLGYGLWGRLVVAMAAALGGGSIRDLLIGGDRLPFYFMSQWEYPVGIFIMVVLATVISRRMRSASGNSAVSSIRYWPENIGNSAIAVNGAFVAVLAQLPWYWAPFCAALSVTGGGLLMDIM
ncbi:MAG: hypothetical protein RIQ43_1568, partial [Pseudomonadota bacterium]